MVGRFLRAHHFAELSVVGGDQLGSLIRVQPHVGDRYVLAVQVDVARVGRDRVVVHRRYEPRWYERTGRIPALADDEVVRGQCRVHRQHFDGAPVLPCRGQHHSVQLTPVQLQLAVIIVAETPLRPVSQAQYDDGGRGFQVEQHGQRVDVYVPIVVHAPGHYRVGKAHDRPEHREPVVQPEAVLAVSGNHYAFPDIVVIQHGHVRFAVVFVRADGPARLMLRRRRSNTRAEDPWTRHQQLPGDVSQRHVSRSIAKR